MVYLYFLNVSGILQFSLKRGLKFSLVQNLMAAIDSEVYQTTYRGSVYALDVVNMKSTSRVLATKGVLATRKEEHLIWW